MRDMHFILWMYIYVCAAGYSFRMQQYNEIMHSTPATNHHTILLRYAADACYMLCSCEEIIIFAECLGPAVSFQPTAKKMETRNISQEKSRETEKT
jgi:hypothetical protein